MHTKRAHMHGTVQVYNEYLESVDLLKDGKKCVSFEQMWRAMEEGMHELVKKQLFSEMDTHIRSQREIWHAHFFSIFEAIDTDRSGVCNVWRGLGADPCAHARIHTHTRTYGACT